MKFFSKHLFAFLLCAGLGSAVFVEAQPPARRKPAARPAAAPKENAAAEKARFDEAVAAATPAEKAELLVKFIADYPKSANKPRARESLAGARAAMADEALTAGNAELAVKLFRVAIDDAPKPYSDRLFNEIIATIPANLFWRGSRAEAYEIAIAIEGHVAANQKQLLAVANFYLGVEDGTEAKRIAESAIKLDEASAAGYQTLGMAHRLNFDLEESEMAFMKAVELDAASAPSKRMLAEMKRALGKSDEATALYQEILLKDENDDASRTGYALALFDAGKRADAETELAKAIEKTPGNVILLAGAAYWYAANKDGAKAVDLARQAVAKEPRFVWSHIALARGQMALGKPVEAEQTLVAARKYGNFPTLQYEIASSRFAAGFYREAVEELRKSFAADADGVKSRLGGRIERTGKSFTDLVSYERRASIFTPGAADSPEAAEQMRALLELDQQLSNEKPDEAAAVAAAEKFTAGADDMAAHRMLYASRALTEKQIAAEKALGYSQSAIAKADAALNVANPGAAVMASELYEARTNAFANNDFLLVPEVPKQTLSSILRGRIEESAGIALLQSGNAAEATVKFRRALSVLPKNSAWWRSATWSLGRALEVEGKNDEALRAYVTSYKTDKPNIARYIAISSLYKKVNGSIDGLEQQIGPSPLANTVASTPPVAVPEPTPETVTTQTRLPATLPVANDTAAKPSESRPEEAKPIEEKKEPVAEPPAEVKQETSVPAEEKPAEPKKIEDLKPVGPNPPEAKPEPSPAEQKPIDEKKETPAEANPVEEKKEPQPEPSPTESKPEEVKKEPASETSEKPPDTPKPIVEDPKPEPKIEKPSETKPVTEASLEPKKPEDAPPPTEEPARPKPQENKPAEPEAQPSEPKTEEPKTEPRRVEVIKTDLTLSPPKPAGTKPPARNATRTRTATTNKPPENAAATNAKPLFEPVIINVPGGWKPKPGEAAAATEAARPEPPVEKMKPCTVGVSQETIAISGEDGTVAVLVSVDEGVDIASVRGVSASDEIEVQREPRIAGIDDRIVYVLKSATKKAGLYQVSFEAPCGRKTVSVRVR